VSLAGYVSRQQQQQPVVRGYQKGTGCVHTTYLSLFGQGIMDIWMGGKATDAVKAQNRTC